MKETTDWAEILHNHTYGHASGRGKKYFRCTHFPLSYVSKITQKKHSVSHKIMMKRAIVLIFCRNMLLDSLQRQLKWFG